MLKALSAILTALKTGEELKDPAKWKNVQNTANTVGIVLASSAVVLKYQWPEFMISDEQLIALSAVVANILFIINRYLTTATTKKIGIGGKDNGKGTEDTATGSSTN